MIRIFCRGKHGEDHLCDSCSELLEYSVKRLDSCRFGDSKPRCDKCEIRCYKAEMRGRIREVMKYSGPRMLCRHPLAVLKHILR